MVLLATVVVGIVNLPNVGQALAGLVKNLMS
jgi:hypothetical protein